MTIFTKAIVLAVLFFPAVSFANLCSGTDEIIDPEQFSWSDAGGGEPHFTGTMEIAEATLLVGVDSITTRVYRQAGARIPRWLRL